MIPSQPRKKVVIAEDEEPIGDKEDAYTDSEYSIVFVIDSCKAIILMTIVS